MSRVQEPELPEFARWRPWGPGVDPIYMEYVLERLEPNVANQLIGVRMAAIAKVHRAIAEGAEQAAKIINGANG